MSGAAEEGIIHANPPSAAADGSRFSQEVQVSRGLLIETGSHQLFVVSPHLCVSLLTFSTGTLNVLLRTKSIASVDTQVWTKSGHQGPGWRKAFIDFSPVGPFQVNSFWLPPLRDGC